MPLRKPICLRVVVDRRHPPKGMRVTSSRKFWVSVSMMGLDVGLVINAMTMGTFLFVVLINGFWYRVTLANYLWQMKHLCNMATKTQICLWPPFCPHIFVSRNPIPIRPSIEMATAATTTIIIINRNSNQGQIEKGPRKDIQNNQTNSFHKKCKSGTKTRATTAALQVTCCFRPAEW